MTLRMRVVKRWVGFVIALFFCLSLSCQMTPTQLQTLTAKIDKNTETTETLLQKQHDTQKELTNALITVVDELAALKKSVADYDTKLEELSSGLDALKEELMARDANSVKEIKTVAAKQKTLQDKVNAEDKKQTTDIKLLTEKQTQTATETTNLKTMCEQLMKQQAELLKQQKQTQQQLTQLQQKVDTLQKQAPKAPQAQPPAKAAEASDAPAS